MPIEQEEIKDVIAAGQEEKKTRSYKLLVEITGVDPDMRCDAVLENVASLLIHSKNADTVRVTNISRFGSVYKRR